ncbi:MAG: lipid-A-disaccharide synthase [Thermodesulfovibrionales bacterium]|nr:lipid-A-disaccharide synthase [Thermodesulfovibrionales bacterium]
MKKILIVAGESSGELYGSLLANALKKRKNNILISGIGGIRMQQAGVDIISPICSAFGTVEILKSIIHIKQTLKKINQYLLHSRPDVVVLIDYPDFNFRVAKMAKKLHIPVLYYVSPQVWAWRKNRIFTIKKIVDKIALILPFEVDIYRSIGVPCEFVGHPVLDDIENFLIRHNLSLKSFDKQKLKIYMKQILNIKTRYVVALLPGSRRHEILSLIKPMVESAVEIIKKYEDVHFLLPIAPNLDEETTSILHHSLGPIKNHTTLIKENPLIALCCADIGIIASGTATFQATMLDVPMVVIYRLSTLSYLLGKLLIKVNYITLTNLLVEKTLMDNSLPKIKELIQDDVNPENILKEINTLLDNETYYKNMLYTFKKIREIFINHNASQRVCDIVLDLIDK